MANLDESIRDSLIQLIESYAEFSHCTLAEASTAVFRKAGTTDAMKVYVLRTLLLRKELA